MIKCEHKIHERNNGKGHPEKGKVTVCLTGELEEIQALVHLLRLAEHNGDLPIDVKSLYLTFIERRETADSVRYLVDKRKS